MSSALLLASRRRARPVALPRRLVASKSSVALSLATGASGATPTVALTNGGGNVLSPPNVSSVVYGSGATNWLTSTPITGSGNSYLLAPVADATGLAAGTYSATIWIRSYGADDSPVTVQVSLTVTATAPAVISPIFTTSDTLSATEGASATTPSKADIPIRNGSTTPFDGLAVVSDESYVTASIANNGTNDVVRLQPNSGIAVLPPGTYSVRAVVSDAAAATDAYVYCNFQIGAAQGVPVVRVTPGTFTFTQQEGASGATLPQQSAVTNAGTGTFASVQASVAYGAGWSSGLTVSVSGSGNAWTVSATASVGGLSAGTYIATVTVSDPTTGASSATISVTFVVTPSGATQFPPSRVVPPYFVDWDPLTDTYSLNGSEPFTMRPDSYFTGTVHRPTTAAQFETMFAAAADRDIIETPVGFLSYASNLTLSSSARGNAGCVWVRSASYSALDALKPIGSRVRESEIGYMTIFEATTNPSRMVTSQGFRGVRFSGIAWMWRQTFIQDVALFEFAPATQTNVAHMAGDGWMDRCLFINDNVNNAKCRRGLTHKGNGLVATDSSFTGFQEINYGATGTSNDTQCILVYNATGALYVDNCEGSATGENLLWGGSSSPLGDNADCWITRSFWFKDTAWATDGGCKNWIETKKTQRLLIDRCEFDYFPGTGQAHGIAITTAALASDPSTTQTRDVHIRNCRTNRGWGDIAINTANNTNPSQPTRDVHIHNILFKNPAGAVPASVSKFYMSTAANGKKPLRNITATKITFSSTGSMFGPEASAAQFADSMENIVWEDCLCPQALTYNVVRASGAADTTMNSGCINDTYSIRGNVGRRNSGSASSQWGTSLAAANSLSNTPIALRDVANGDYQCVDARYATISTTGGYPGVDMDHLNAMLAGVIAGTRVVS